MEKQNKYLVISFICFLAFITVSFNAVYKGITHHETWRIAMGACGGGIFLLFLLLVTYTFMKNKKNAIVVQAD